MRALCEGWQGTWPSKQQHGQTTSEETRIGCVGCMDALDVWAWMQSAHIAWPHGGATGSKSVSMQTGHSISEGSRRLRGELLGRFASRCEVGIGSAEEEGAATALLPSAADAEREWDALTGLPTTVPARA